MKINKKTISAVLAMVIAVISSCMTFACDKTEQSSSNNITTYQKTTVFSDGIFKSNTIINGSLVLEVKYPCGTVVNDSKNNTFYRPKKNDKIISYKPLIDVNKLSQQINTEVESIKAEVNAKVREALSDILGYISESITQKEFTETTQATTKKEDIESTTEATTISVIEIDRNVNYSEFVKKVVELTNEERAKYGLQPLVLSDSLCKAAQEHANDMSSKNYFSHTSQDGRTVPDRIKKYISNYNYAGENIAYGYESPESVVQCWMNSKGHKANILEPNFMYIGVGYSDSYWVQDFSG